MPSRIIRVGFVDSEAVCSLSDWAHRVYSNLLLKVDDAGRYDARLEILRSHLFPLGTERRGQEFEAALKEFESTALATRYQFEGKAYLQVFHWQRSGNAQRSKFPWKDGSIDIRYVVLATDAGPKEFVFSSIRPKKMASACHPDGVTTPPNDEIRIPNNESSNREGPEGGKPPAPPPPPEQPKSPKRALTDLWCAEYERHHGVKYLFQGAKDGIAADKLLRLQIPVESIIQIAKEAWKRPDSFNCKNACDLSRFASCFNAIRAEITVQKRAPGKTESF